MNTTTKSRNPWPASIIGFFILAIIFITTFIVWAAHQREDLVSTNYYENEVRFQQQLDSLNRSQAIARQVVVTYDPSQRSIIITLPAGQFPGVTGSVYLYRPSDARLDRDFPLALNAEGIQRLDAKELRDGFWKVRIKWNAAGNDFFLDQSVIVTSS